MANSSDPRERRFREYFNRLAQALIQGHTFGALAERLAATVRFVGVDLRGHGFSDKPPAGYDLDRHVEDVRQLIAALGMRRPVLLGHSAGGTVAAFVALATDVAGLILLEAMIGNRAFTENAAAQAAPLATSLGFARRRLRRLSCRVARPSRTLQREAERLLDRWVWSAGSRTARAV